MKIRKIEKAQFIFHKDELFKLDTEINRIYFGTEFCENLLPEKENLLEIIDICHKKKIKYTFVTPFCSDTGINRLQKLFNHYPKNEEIVINDLGVLNILLTKKQNSLVFGRVLTRNIKDPRIYRLEPEKAKLFQKSILETTLFENFLRANNIKRVEIDNILQGYKENAFKKDMNISLYYPYVYIAASKSCLFKNVTHYREYFNASSKNCKKSCLKETLITKLKSVELEIINSAKGSFYFNSAIDENKLFPYFNRIVFFKNYPK